MLNKDGVRELAYVVKVNDIKPIDGADRVELAYVGGWSVMVRKGQFSKGCPAIYFEIDSKVPEGEPFKFLEDKHYKVKTQKYFKGKVISQGLLMGAGDFGWKIESDAIIDDHGITHNASDESRFLTKQIGVVYCDEYDNTRKASFDPNAKYKSMSSRHSKLFKTPLFRWLMRREWGKKMLFAFFGSNVDKNKYFPTKFPYIHKTDEERCENIPNLLEDKQKWIVSTKVDGTSSTYILEKLQKKYPWSKQSYEYYVCSRNIRLMKPDQKTYHDSNVYWEMSEKYHIKEALQTTMELHPELSYVCIQGETAGVGVQGNPHKFPDTRFFAFNFIDSERGRWNSLLGKKYLEVFNIPWVPIVDENYVLPDTMEELKAQADGPCEAPDSQGLREGYVYRSYDGQQSFKNVSNKYLLSRG